MLRMLRYSAMLASGLLVASADAQEPPAFDTDQGKLSYALGAQIGKDLRDQSIEVTPELLFKGIGDALSGRLMLMSEQEIEARVNSFRQELRQKLALAARKLSEENKRKGAEFLEANKQQESVIALENGLQYKIVKQGDGPKPTADDRVVVHYRGTLVDGTEFDSSHASNQPATFPVKQVIKGWREALQLMPVGSTWQLFIPAHLAYGARGVGRQIGPNATLIFEVDLIAIEDASVPSVPPAADVTDLVISFKLDPRFLGGTYGQVGWITPETYQGISGQDTVEAKADGLDATGTPVAGINAEWIPENPDMVTVSPGEDGSVKIIVRSPGESSLKVVYGDLSKTLSIKARAENDALQIEISQL
jgi:FKBP-type peptidyl-prolyl cis-trans isomerase FklB